MSHSNVKGQTTHSIRGRACILPVIQWLGVILVSGSIVIGGLIDQAALNGIYRWFGYWFDISWLGNGGNTTLVSDVGHGLSAFLLSFLLLLRCRSEWWLMLSVVAFVAIVETGQMFIENRESSLHDFAYSVIGIFCAWSLIVILWKILQRPRFLR